MTKLQTGSPAPRFELPVNGGGSVSLDGLKGRPFVLYFYPKDATTGCTQEASSFNSLMAEFERAGVAVVGVSPDSVASHDRFVAKLDLGFPLAADEDHSVAEAYEVWVEKKMYGRTFMGVERATFLIDANGRIARIWRKVRVPGHAEEVLEAAKNL